MSKKDEAMKLALEALAVRFSEGWHEGIKIDASDILLLNDAAQALAEQQAQQEPVATVVSESGNPNVSMSWWHEPALPVGTKLYTSPPAQRTWVGLTDEEWQSIADILGCFITRGQKDAIEAALGIKEKNT